MAVQGSGSVSSRVDRFSQLCLFSHYTFCFGRHCRRRTSDCGFSRAIRGRSQRRIDRSSCIANIASTTGEHSRSVSSVFVMLISYLLTKISHHIPLRRLVKSNRGLAREHIPPPSQRPCLPQSLASIDSPIQYIRVIFPQLLFHGCSCHLHQRCDASNHGRRKRRPPRCPCSLRDRGRPIAAKIETIRLRRFVCDPRWYDPE
jgi:hypothetical protein